MDGPRIARPSRVVATIVIVLALIASIYYLGPRLLGLEEAVEKLGDGDPVWIGVAFAFSIPMFLAYVALFKGVVGEAVRLSWREVYEINMAGLAATRLFSAGGAGGIALTMWALIKAGMPRGQCASRMLAFLELLYLVYMVALLVDGVLLWTSAVPGAAPAGLTIVPALLAAALIALFLATALIPEHLDRRMAEPPRSSRPKRLLRALAALPAAMSRATRIALGFVREPSRGALAIAGAVGFWAANVAILWASFEAFGADVPVAVLVQGFFVGLATNLLPSPPGGVGAIDAGMIGTFVLFGVPAEVVFPAVLAYRLFAFWLPTIPGAIAFFSLLRTVRRWGSERSSESRSEGTEPIRIPAAGEAVG